MPRPASASPVLALLVLLAACAAPGDRPAAGRAEDQSAAACMRSCNRSYDVCAESGAARSGSGPFPGDATCQRDLRQCQAGCRAPQ